MKLKKKSGFFVVIGIVAVIAIMASSAIGSYNRLVGLDEQVSSQWAQVENQYQRRFDLIPNLVSTVKGYATHEESVLAQVTEARSKLGGVVSIDDSLLTDEAKFREFQKMQDTLGGALQRLLSVTENYPQLQANQNFLALQDQLEGTENRISVERKRFNEIVQQYNSAIRRFPGALLAKIAGFQGRPYFTAAEEAQSAPKVEF
jgi:LemA protein